MSLNTNSIEGQVVYSQIISSNEAQLSQLYSFGLLLFLGNRSRGTNISDAFFRLKISIK